MASSAKDDRHAALCLAPLCLPDPGRVRRLAAGLSGWCIWRRATRSRRSCRPMRPRRSSTSSGVLRLRQAAAGSVPALARRHPDRRLRHLDRHRRPVATEVADGVRQHHHPGHRRRPSWPSRSPSCSARRRPTPIAHRRSAGHPDLAGWVSVPHFWLAIVLVIIFAVELELPCRRWASGRKLDRLASRSRPPRPYGPADHRAVGDPARRRHPTVRSTIKETLSMEFVTALQARA